uniref:protein S100-Z isoform X2 n=1 Tax=Scatophagus argus TaxID=75038 RepID=UPI001ED7DEAB|nr:protein S100-Z isoform X2 [Scatophagus argus]
MTENSAPTQTSEPQSRKPDAFTFLFSLRVFLHSDGKPQSQKDPMLVEKIMNDLDSNKDNEVDFNEFVVLVAALTVACNDFFQEQKKKNK